LNFQRTSTVSHDQPVKAPPIAPPPTNVAQTKDLVDTEKITPKVEVSEDRAGRTSIDGTQTAASVRHLPPAFRREKSPLIVNPDSVSYF
jgi:hypothetical protein